MTEPTPALRPSSSEGLPLAAPLGVFAELGKLLHPTGDVAMTQVLQRIADLAATVLPELADVSVTLIERGEPRTVVFTGPLAPYLDERQYGRKFGPCLDAALTGSTITVHTADRDGDYPEFAAVAAGRGVTRVLAVGLPIPQTTIGALNLYSTASEAFTPESVQLAETFAGYAAVAVFNAVMYDAAVAESRNLHEALKTRAVIEQAKGILMGLRHCSAEQAFSLLTQASQHQNRKLHEIATEVVEHARAPQPGHAAAEGRLGGTLRSERN
ncbi:GAF and ANTAR domain-containing protein [Microlunatus capsulatus]|uniref:Transcriptional regulator with GAF, ATPase, and Fis domain n=1 Tax=Microlunatus capsulatus TaxID=99117 RepID=A0ABS4Z5L7_9ACTN|nr:GAF and ANTAR domain-containing protein [Microlunatus capsulatus]MBP2416100.1 transcriptional regulator with GAF, ATPase, and Fis domain [Microlunatus capsulatus]